MPRQHARNVGTQHGADINPVDLTTLQKKIIETLASLDKMPVDYDSRGYMPRCVNRRRLRASEDIMHDLYFIGIVNGAGTRDAHGTGTTPDSSWWWLTSHGLDLAKSLGNKKQ